MEGQRSYFDGNTLQLIGWRLLSWLITVATLGIAYPWAMCMMYRWEVKHTVINGRRLQFTGKGIQLWGWYLLWSFLTIITFGIYGIWLGVNLEKWRVKHTVYKDDYSEIASRFTGGAGGWFVNHLFVFFLSFITLGIARPWAEVHFLKWKAERTKIGGSQLVFSGTGGQLFVKYLLRGIFSVLTLGIYNLFFPVIYLKWEVSKKDALYQMPEMDVLSREHEIQAKNDYAKYMFAGNDTELEIMRTGINGKESMGQLIRMSEEGNPYAKYALAMQLKGDKASFDEQALGFLKESADAGYYRAMFAYAPYAKDKDAYLQLLEGSAKGGSREACWQLKRFYEDEAEELYEKGDIKALEMLKKSAYWFKVAAEQKQQVALEHPEAYNKMLETIKIWQCTLKPPTTKNGAGMAVAIVAGIILMAALVLGSVMLFKMYEVIPAMPTTIIQG